MDKLDKNEYNLKLEEIDKYVNQGNYAEAVKVADTIDWRRVRNVRTLCMISEIYEADNRYEDSKEILLRAYRRSPVGRSILYRLVEVTIQLKQFDEAIEYYSEYVQAAPHDNNKYILKYKIYRGRGSSLEEQIDILKEYLSQEYNEKWAYELAKLYQQAGRIQECLASCDDLVLWFHSGKYVTKALELKQRYAPLTPKQQEIYERRFEEEDEETDDMFSDETRLGQEKQMVETHEEALADTIMADTEKEIAQAVAQSRQEDMREVVPFSEEADGVAEDVPAGAAAEAVQADAGMAEEDTETVPAMGETEEDAEAVPVIGEAEEDTEALPAVERTGKNTEDPSMEETEEDTGSVPAMEDTEAARNGKNAGDVDREISDAELAGEMTEAASAQEYNEEVVESADRTAETAEQKNLQSELVKSMREIVCGVVRREEPDEDELAADRVIQKAAEEQESMRAASGAETPEVPRMQIPKRPQNAQAGQLSIDDILLSMGDKGDAVRKAAAQSAAARQARAAAPAGAVSAMDEALMNMGMKPEEIARQEKEETIPVKEEAAPALKPETAQEKEESREDVILAKTRRIPTEEISQLHASYDIPQVPAQEDENVPPQPDMEKKQAPARKRRAAAAEAVKAPEQPERPRVRSQVRRMTLKDYHRDLFPGFLEIQNLEDQIASAIAMAEQKGEDRTSRTGNILIFGDHGCGKSTIALGIAKAIAMDKGNQYAKMARIYATDLNRKDIAATIAKIAGGTLIIEEAGDLEDAIVDQLTTAMEFRTDGLIIILEDEQKYIHELLMRHPRFTMKFTSQIFIPVFTIDELVRFGEIYAGNQDYVFSQAAAQALYERIGSVAAQGDAVSITNVIELVDRAIHKSNKFFRKMASGKKRYDENDCVILQEKDFKK